MLAALAPVGISQLNEGEVQFYATFEDNGEKSPVVFSLSGNPEVHLSPESGEITSRANLRLSRAIGADYLFGASNIQASVRNGSALFSSKIK